MGNLLEGNTAQPAAETPPASPSEATPLPTPEIVKNPLEVSNDLKDRREVIKEAMSKIRSLFADKALNLKFDRALRIEDSILSIITSPLGDIDKAWKADIEKASNEEEIASLFAAYTPQINSVLQFANGYLDDLTANTGWITPEVLAKMEKDMQQLSKNLSALIMKPANKDVLNALMWAQKAALANGDQYSEAPEAMATLQKRIPIEYPKGDRGLMPSLWVIMSFMGKAERADLVKNYITKTPIDLRKFLKTGNSRGVFTAEEMIELGSSAKITYSEKEKQWFTEAWRIQNDHRKQAAEMMMPSYGSANPANEMLTLGNISLTFIQFIAGTTIVGNIITDTFQGGKPKNFEGIVKAIAKPHNWIAGGAIAAINIYRNGLTWKESLESKGSRDSAKEKTAYQKLNLVMNGDNSWKNWNNFFKKQDGNGMRVFFAHLQEMKKLNDGKIDENLAKSLNGPQFSEYLDAMAKNPEADKKVDYAGLKRSFDEIKSTANMITLGQIFDQLNLGGAITVEEYESEIKKADQFA